MRKSRINSPICPKGRRRRGPGSIVGLIVERSFSMMIGLLGILKAGGAYLPAGDRIIPPDRIRYLLQDAGVRVLLVQEADSFRKLVSFDGKTVDLESLDTYQGSAENPSLRQRSPADLAYVIYTSGSTGRPKGVMVEHRSVVNRLHWMQFAYPIASGDVILQKTPYYFDVSVWELFWWAIDRRAALAFLPSGRGKNPDGPRRCDSPASDVTVLHFVPSVLNVFLEYLDGRDERRDLFAGLGLAAPRVCQRRGAHAGACSKVQSTARRKIRREIDQPLRTDRSHRGRDVV